MLVGDIGIIKAVNLR